MLKKPIEEKIKKILPEKLKGWVDRPIKKKRKEILKKLKEKEKLEYLYQNFLSAKYLQHLLKEKEKMHLLVKSL